GHDADAQPVGGEITGHQSGKDVERCAAFPRGGDDFLGVGGIRGGEYLDQFGNYGSGECAAGDDGRQLPPQRIVAAQGGNDQLGDHKGENNGDDGCDPDQGGQGRFKVHVVGITVPSLG